MQAQLVRCIVVAVGLLACERVEQKKVPVALAMAFEANEIFIGNATYEQDENARYNGVLPILHHAIDDVPPAKFLPDGSQGMLIAFADRPRVLVPMGPVARIDRNAFGSELDYRGFSGNNRISAIKLAIAELAKVDARRRILYVFAFGILNGADEMRTELAKLQPEIDRLRIELHESVYAMDAIGLFPNFHTLGSEAAVKAEWRAIWTPRPIGRHSSRRPRKL